MPQPREHPSQEMPPEPGAQPGTLATRVAGLAAELAGFSVGVVVIGARLVGASGLDAEPHELAAFAHAAAGRSLPDAARDARLSAHPFVSSAPHLRSVVAYALRPGLGWLIVADPAPDRMPAASEPAMRALAALAADVSGTAEEHALLRDVTRRAARADRILGMISQAASCADALTGLLGELCRHHGAPVGRIWRLEDGGLMHELSRFLQHDYYRRSPSRPVRAGTSMTAEAISRNEPMAIIYSQVADTALYALMPAAVATGLRSQVSYPIWVQEERFGIALAFDTERQDLAEIVADIDALSDAIRPALFRKVTEDRIRHMALHDELTQLANRTVFNERLADAVGAAARGEQGLALLYLDLDGFKRVNDVRGHSVGDKLLAQAAERMRSLVDEADTLARLGGDEFAVVQPRHGQPLAAMQLAQRLIHELGRTFDIDGQPSTIGASVGIALYAGEGQAPDSLLRNADAALYVAKASGRNTSRVFEPALARQREERFLLERDLKEAVAAQAFALAYQPICDAKSLRVRGLEALLRWSHPVRGPVGPNEFVPIAEATGLIVPLGRWALEAACAAASSWAEPVRLSVNLSPLQFRQPGLASLIADTLSRYGLSAERLDLEVTEGLLLDDSGEVLQTMHALREHGVRMTLDDFGTAYASLSYLRRFPFDRIKIDMSFIQGMIGDDGTQAIVEAVLSLGDRLRLDVVAEGVETEEQLERLRELGCAQVQGYLTGRPMHQDRAQWLLSQKQPAAGA